MCYVVAIAGCNSGWRRTGAERNGRQERHKGLNQTGLPLVIVFGVERVQESAIEMAFSKGLQPFLQKQLRGSANHQFMFADCREFRPAIEAGLLQTDKPTPDGTGGCLLVDALQDHLDI